MPSNLSLFFLNFAGTKSLSMSKVIISFLFLFALAACRNTESSAPAAENGAAKSAVPVREYTDYELDEVPGTQWRRLTLRDSIGRVLEQGFLDENGLQTGNWIIYYPEKGMPYKLTSFVAGKQNGLYFFFNQIGQITLMSSHIDNELDGPWAKYRFGRLEEEAHYKAGKLHGPNSKYDIREGYLQSRTEYRDGIQHGMYRTYNKEGKVTTEYEFRDGKQVSGGMK